MDCENDQIQNSGRDVSIPLNLADTMTVGVETSNLDERQTRCNIWW